MEKLSIEFLDELQVQDYINSEISTQWPNLFSFSI